MGDEKAANELVDVIRDIVRQEINKTDATILCQVKNKKGSDHYDVIIVPDEQNIVKNVVNMTRFDLQEGDYVYVYKINNQLSNCFICYKITPYYENYDVVTQEKIYGDSTTIYNVYNNTYSGDAADISALQSTVSSHINNTTVHVNAANKTSWDNKVTADVETLDLDDKNLTLKK